MEQEQPVTKTRGQELIDQIAPDFNASEEYLRKQLEGPVHELVRLNVSKLIDALENGPVTFLQALEGSLGFMYTLGVQSKKAD